jgi:NHL repeat
VAYIQIIPAALLLAAVQLLEAQTIFNPAPSRIVGQAVLQQQEVLTAIAPNLVEGREFNNPQAVAIDMSVTPHILYVADFGNNRVLAWKNASGFTKGDYADLAIGQRDLLSTSAEGPGGDLSTGLASPVGLVVDAKGNLYVVDAGNNRVLRYPKPFAQTVDLLAVDLIIGQLDLNGNSPNAGQIAPTAATLVLANGSGVFRAGIAFDGQGNLWVSDPGNNRVLRFPGSALTTGSPNQPAADLVLGQNDFSSTSLPPNVTRSGKNYLSQPAGIAFDLEGRLFIADSANRVVVYAPPFAIGQASARVMGVVTTPNAPLVSASTLGAVDSNGYSAPPQGIFFAGNNPYVVDTGNARILSYNSFDQWPPESSAFSPPAQSVIGQIDFQSTQSNRGLAQPNATTFAGPQPHPFVSGPVSAVFDADNRMSSIRETIACSRFRNSRSGHSASPRACLDNPIFNTTRSTGSMAEKLASVATMTRAA